MRHLSENSSSIRKKCLLINFQKNRNEFLIFSTLVSLNLALKILLRKASLSIWDDVEYAYRVQHGMLYAHSPGYPGYMILGRIFYLTYSFFTGASSEQSMILLSAVLGGLLVIPVYLLIRTLWGTKEAITGSLFVMLNPFLAEMSSQAMSDIPSVFFIALAVSLFYFGFSKNNMKIITFSAAVYGFSIAVRLTNLIALPFFLVAAYSRMRQSFNRTRALTLIALFLSISAFCSGITYIPLICEKGLNGFIGFLTEYHEVNQVSYTIVTLKERILFLTSNLIDSITPVASVICLLGLYQLFLKQKAIFRDFCIWIFTYLSFFVLYGPAVQMNRFSLPVYPVLAATFAYGLRDQFSKLKRTVREKRKANPNTWVTFGFLFLIFSSIFVWSLPIYRDLEYWSRHSFSPKLVALWIARTVPAESVIVCGSYCWVLQYYLDLPDPSPRLIWGDDPSWVTYSINKSLAEGKRVFVVSEQVERCKFLAENFKLELYGQYDETLSLYEIFSRSID